MARKDKEAAVKLARVVGGVVVVAAIAAFVVHNQNAKRRETAAVAAAWTVTGEPCPTTTLAAAPPRGLVYEAVTFSRDKGAINCNTIQPGGTGTETPVCMFMGPGNLRIATATTTVDYAPPAGVPATVTIRDGKPECVMHFNRALFN
jgi:hypothetical protein